ncbi:MAG: VIT1/CCC1 transporter family protein [Spirochaetales bacterium]
MQNTKLKLLKKMQINEITDYTIYKNTLRHITDKNSVEIAKSVMLEEEEHYKILANISKKHTRPKRFKILWFKFLRAVFGCTFIFKILHKQSTKISENYLKLSSKYENLEKILKEEEEHEAKLLELIKDDRITYLGSIVLALNDAIVELTGVIVGLTFAMSDTRVISLSALVTGIASALSMASSEYLSLKTEESKNIKKATIYNGVTYLMVVLIMILPYLFISDKFIALSIMMLFVVFIILIFTYYTHIVKGDPLKQKFLQMLFICITVASISFVLGYLIKIFLGVTV